jgi:hypothetical protein
MISNQNILVRVDVKPTAGKLGIGYPPVDLLDARVGAASGFELLIHGAFPD